MRWNPALLLAFAIACSACQPIHAVVEENEAAESLKLAIDAASPTEAEAKREVRQQAAENIAGCAVAAISVESDPAGLNVRAGPSKDAPILGKLASLIETDPHSPDDPPIPSDKAFGPSFTITALSGSWLKIADIDPETEGWDTLARKRMTRRNFQGAGWVHRSKVAVDPGFHDSAYDQPYSAPGNWTVVEEKAGRHLALTGGKQGETAALLACERDWLNIRYISKADDGTQTERTGWFKIGPHFIGLHICAAADSECKRRQTLELWN